MLKNLQEIQEKEKEIQEKAKKEMQALKEQKKAVKKEYCTDFGSLVTSVFDDVEISKILIKCQEKNPKMYAKFSKKYGDINTKNHQQPQQLHQPRPQPQPQQLHQPQPQQMSQSQQQIHQLKNDLPFDTQIKR